MKKETKEGLAGAATAVLAGGGVAPRLLGYHNVYHGTTKPAAEAVKKHGFDPKKGGTGASSPTVDGKGVGSNPNFYERSKGRIHTTKRKPIAGIYSLYVRHKHGVPGTVVKARVTHQHFKGMKGDPDMSPGATKNIAATTHHKIPASQVVGGAGDKGIKGVVTKNTLRKYYSSGSGLARAARGVVLAGIAAKGAHTAYKSVHEKKAEKIDFEKEKAGAAALVATLGTKVPSRLLGYHRVYHGTKVDHAVIQKEGLQPAFGGTGASSTSGTYKRRSTGRVHVTKSRIFARMYGRPVKATVSHGHWESMKEDITHNMGKDRASTTHHAIPAHQIKGGEGYRGIRGVVTKNTLRKYYTSKVGLKRAAGGLAYAAASGLATKYLLGKAKEKLTK